MRGSAYPNSHSIDDRGKANRCGFGNVSPVEPGCHNSRPAGMGRSYERNCRACNHCFERAGQIQPLHCRTQVRDTQGSPQLGLRRLPMNHSIQPTFRMGTQCSRGRGEPYSTTQRLSDAVPSYVPFARELPRIATGLTGEPVAPTSLSGVQTKKKR
jgi:hypothetical protein